ncbi:membrane cofactor protein, partial [Eurytemora carolleeae]|uniref:membrane cofactor protein n=1 Tax=Eurytemora carolleeae TaxID=1294199 RepID=UPI000C757BA8
MKYVILKSFLELNAFHDVYTTSHQTALIGRYQFGSVATYKCNPGFILWGNASRVCNSDGNWDGETPLCHPITCGQPPQIESGSFELINGSTTWQSLAYYACSTGYTNSII